jgi:hypothetical protein
LANQDLDRVRSLHARIWCNALPTEQEAQKVARRDRLDLGAQPTYRVAVDAREQPALAPLLRPDVWGKAATQREALGLE